MTTEALALGLRTRHDPEDHRLFLTWMILTSILVFAFIVAYDRGFMGLLYVSDRSFISFIITTIFVGTSIHCALLTYRISRETNLTRAIEKRLHGAGVKKLSLSGDNKVLLGGREELPPSLLTHAICDMLRVRMASKDVREVLDAGEGSQSIIEGHIRKYRSGTETGWFVADGLIKLGLLGTVIGFIIMLGSVVDVTRFDASVMQDILTKMSIGMGVALYTTLTGLIFGGLLGLEYHVLDRGTEHLGAALHRIIDVEVATRLPASSAKAKG